jgi:signal transduction histidine kinase
MPYTMNAAVGEQSIAFMARFEDPTSPVALTFDLGEPQRLDRIHLHRIELSNNMPLSKAFDYGMPRRLVVEGANDADFSDSTRLLDLTLKNAYETGPIIMRDLEHTAYQFIRLTAIEPFIDTLMPEPMVAFGFAEIELFSNQTNVAYQKTPTPNFEYSSQNRPRSNLTDGHNFYGKILPIREWLEQLEERYQLEAKRPLIRAELDRRYARQTVMLRRMGWLAILLTTGMVVIFLVERILRLRQITHIRERFAADLHDDLGASLHTIGLLGDIALASMQSPERLKTALERTRDLTKRTSATIRHCTDLQTNSRLGDLELDMRRIAERILVNIDYTTSVQGAEQLNKLKPRLKMDLFLFVKEGLTNIVKHSNADQVRIEIMAHPKSIEIIIQDNGRGLPSEAEQKIPPSLKRRARVMNASISISKTPEYSTVIHLIRKKHSLFFWK